MEDKFREAFDNLTIEEIGEIVNFQNNSNPIPQDHIVLETVIQVFEGSDDFEKSWSELLQILCAKFSIYLYELCHVLLKEQDHLQNELICINSAYNNILKQ